MTAHTIELETGGMVWKTLVSEGADVEEGQELFILEVMKMEVPYTAPVSGKLVSLNIKEGDVVEEDQCAAIIEA